MQPCRSQSGRVPFHSANGVTADAFPCDSTSPHVHAAARNRDRRLCPSAPAAPKAPGHRRSRTGAARGAASARARAFDRGIDSPLRREPATAAVSGRRVKPLAACGVMPGALRRRRHRDRLGAAADRHGYLRRVAPMSAVATLGAPCQRPADLSSSDRSRRQPRHTAGTASSPAGGGPGWKAGGPGVACAALMRPTFHQGWAGSAGRVSPAFCAVARPRACG